MPRLPTVEIETQGPQGSVNGIDSRADGSYEIRLCVELRRGRKVSRRGVIRPPRWTVGEVAT
jgi:hypothetical protein